MAETIKTLAQANPSATTLTDLYTVPGATSVTSSTLVVCNRGSSTIAVRVSVAVGGTTDDPKQYLLYDRKIRPYDAEFLTIGMTLAATDVVRVRTDIATASFNLFGVEVT